MKTMQTTSARDSKPLTITGREILAGTRVPYKFPSAAKHTARRAARRAVTLPAAPSGSKSESCNMPSTHSLPPFSSS